MIIQPLVDLFDGLIARGIAELPACIIKRTSQLEKHLMFSQRSASCATVDLLDEHFNHAIQLTLYIRCGLYPICYPAIYEHDASGDRLVCDTPSFALCPVFLLHKSIASKTRVYLQCYFHTSRHRPRGNGYLLPGNRPCFATPIYADHGSNSIAYAFTPRTR
jgi:hypothetical protein